MPKLNLNKKRVLKLIGKNISDKELLKKVPYLGVELEGITEKEIEVEIFPNRPDLLSEEGFSRALKSFLNIKKGKEYKLRKSNYEVNVDKSVENVRPYTVCAIIKNVCLDKEKLESIINLQEKLHVTHGRKRKKCAIGIYPLNKLKFPISYMAKDPKNIKFRTLESDKELTAFEILKETKKGREFAHLLENKEKYPLFIDYNKNILSMPPIVNSYDTGLVQIEDKELFVECSGSSFESVSKALSIICHAMMDMEFEIYEVKVNYENNSITTPDFSKQEIKVSKNYINEYLGLNLTEKEIVNCLEKMNIKYLNEKAIIPSYRTDILSSVDIIEDVAIGYGYYNIKTESEKVFTPGKEIHLEKIKRKLTDYLTGMSLIENVSYNIVNKKLQEKIKHEKITTLMHPVSLEYNSLRKTILISLLKNLKNNKNSGYPQEIFEFGTTYKEKEIESLGIILAGDFTLTNILQNLNQIQKALNLEFKLEKQEYKYFIEGRSFGIELNKKLVGFIGEIKPEIIELFELEVPLVGLELNFEELVKEIKTI